MDKRKIEIKTRITGYANGRGKLTLTVKNGWSFKHWMNVENTESIRTYLKSDEFKEFAYSVFSKYEDMTYEEMHNSYKIYDFLKIWNKLDRFAWRPSKEQFQIDISLKLSNTRYNYFNYRVEFSNNKGVERLWFKRFYFYENCLNKPDTNVVLDNFATYLYNDKALNDKLATYKNWNSFRADVDAVRVLIYDCLKRAKSASLAA